MSNDQLSDQRFGTKAGGQSSPEANQDRAKDRGASWTYPISMRLGIAWLIAVVSFVLMTRTSSPSSMIAAVHGLWNYCHAISQPGAVGFAEMLVGGMTAMLVCVGTVALVVLFV